MEIGNLPEKDFRGIMVKMMEKIQGIFNKELEDLMNIER